MQRFANGRSRRKQATNAIFQLIVRQSASAINQSGRVTALVFAIFNRRNLRVDTRRRGAGRRWLLQFATSRRRAQEISRFARCFSKGRDSRAVEGRFLKETRSRICVIDRYLLKWIRCRVHLLARSFFFSFFPQRSLSLRISPPFLRLLSHSVLFFSSRPVCRSAFAIRTRYFVAPHFRVHSRPPIRRVFYQGGPICATVSRVAARELVKGFEVPARGCPIKIVRPLLCRRNTSSGNGHVSSLAPTRITRTRFVHAARNVDPLTSTNSV